MRSIWLGVCVGADHDDWDFGGLRLRLQLLEHFAAVNVGKVEIEQDELRVLGARHLESFSPVSAQIEISSRDGPTRTLSTKRKLGSLSFDVTDARFAVGAGAWFR